MMQKTWWRRATRGFPAGILAAVLAASTSVPAAVVITESGGPLSHGAVTARELGIPAVMSVHGCLTQLKPGQTVRVNGATGQVSRVPA